VTLRTKRAYDPADSGDGTRYLVDRLWPRGVSADRLRLAAWRKDLAPSAELRRWYCHDPARFDEFRALYRAELLRNPGALEALRVEARHGPVTLVFGARDEVRSNVAVLAELLAERATEGRPPVATRRGSAGSPTTPSAPGRRAVGARRRPKTGPPR